MGDDALQHRLAPGRRSEHKTSATAVVTFSMRMCRP